MIQSGFLLHNLITFGRLLRVLGMDVTPARMADLVQACSYLDLGRRADFKNAARAILVGRREHLELFHHAFDLFWRSRRHGTPVDLGKLLRRLSHIEQPQIIATAALEEHARAGSESAETPPAKQTYSPREVLRQKDFADLSGEEMKQVRALMQSMSWDLDQRRTRRKISGRHPIAPDMRRTMRSSLRYGAEPLLFKWKSRKKKPRPLVLLCDISGSMEPYSRLLLQFIYVISRGIGHMEAFVFGTRLTRITLHLKDRNVDTALREATGAIEDWAGGTRIGDALKDFNYRWARRVLGQGATVLVISDGWDRGEIGLLGKEMARLQRSCHRLIWLNPLLGSPRYEPLTRGIQTALGYVDDFLPVHNLASLEQLGDVLEGLSERRPARPQGEIG